MSRDLAFPGGQLFVAAFTAAVNDRGPDHYELLIDVDRDVLEAAFFASIGCLFAAVTGLAQLQGKDVDETLASFCQHVGLYAAGASDG